MRQLWILFILLTASAAAFAQTAGDAASIDVAVSAYQRAHTADRWLAITKARLRPSFQAFAESKKFTGPLPVLKRQTRTLFTFALGHSLLRYEIVSLVDGRFRVNNKSLEVAETDTAAEIYDKTLRLLPRLGRSSALSRALLPAAFATDSFDASSALAHVIATFTELMKSNLDCNQIYAQYQECKGAVLKMNEDGGRLKGQDAVCANIQKLDDFKTKKLAEFKDQTRSDAIRSNVKSIVDASQCLSAEQLQDIGGDKELLEMMQTAPATKMKQKLVGFEVFSACVEDARSSAKRLIGTSCPASGSGSSPVKSTSGIRAPSAR